MEIKALQGHRKQDKNWSESFWRDCPVSLEANWWVKTLSNGAKIYWEEVLQSKGYGGGRQRSDPSHEPWTEVVSHSRRDFSVSLISLYLPWLSKQSFLTSCQTFSKLQMLSGCHSSGIITAAIFWVRSRQRLCGGGWCSQGVSGFFVCRVPNAPVCLIGLSLYLMSQYNY